ncbi:SEC-C metal-binding domain-containing protein [Ruminococcus sp. HUN007]|uniref:SEC-C metal-binding domain-containing protein n=1 Tax=Ruminococcus sp. HUN007 TaxID=1514668 RepID=UPI000678B9A2|nr:SEC-C metal-binding domain-containing protein [Ruminococcus sp. HUN007]
MAIDSPGSKSEILKLAAEYLENDNPGKAIKLLENTSVSENDDEIQHMLAVAYADRKWSKKAIAQYRKCLASDRISSSLIQDYSEFMLDSGEHEELKNTLLDLLGRLDPAGDNSAMCIAMLYSMLGDCKLNKIETDITPDFLKEYLGNNPKAAGKAFFSSIIRYLSGTPNDISITPVTDRLIKIMADAVPSVVSDTEFQKAAAEFEISLILYANMVDPLTLLGMRTAKLKFADPKHDNISMLRYLVFDAKMTVVDNIRTKTPDTSRFASSFPYLWSLISGFVNGALISRDLKQFTRSEIYSDLRNASPELTAILKSNLSPDGFAALNSFLNTPASAAGVTAGRKNTNKNQAVSSKISPNAPCPCGSGKKYKKCCGLK